jgi:hypothetical protein
MFANPLFEEISYLFCIFNTQSSILKMFAHVADATGERE